MIEADLVMELIEILEGLRRYRRWYRGRSLPIRNSAMMLLMFLEHNLPKDCPGLQPSELGELLRFNRSTITTLVNSLEDHGLVERLNAEDDRRVVFVRPTEQGIKLVYRARREFTASIAELIQYLGPEDGEELIRIMRRVRGYLEDREATQDRGESLCGD